MNYCVYYLTVYDYNFFSLLIASLSDAFRCCFAYVRTQRKNMPILLLYRLASVWEFLDFIDF